MLVLVRDITDQKRQHVITEQLEQKAVVARELHLQNKELTRANHVISNFLGTLSHELNTPLTSLIAFTDILSKNKEGNLTPKQKQQLEAMNRSGTQLNWWYDVKVYNDHAYWVTEVRTAGVGIKNLNDLECVAADPGTTIEATARWGVDEFDVGPDPVTGYVRAHNIAINPEEPEQCTGLYC